MLTCVLFAVHMRLHRIVLETNSTMCMLFISLTRKYKVIRETVPFVLQLTNYLCIVLPCIWFEN